MNQRELTVCVSTAKDIIDAYQHREPAEGRKLMTKLIDTLAAGVPAALTELRTLGRTLHRRRDDVLAYFDHPGTSNGPTEAIKCRRRHLIAYADVWVMPIV